MPMAPHPPDRFDLRPGFTLAEAIRKGSADTRQCVGHFFERHPLDGVIATCVHGAAMLGLLGAAVEDDDTISPYFAAYPELEALYAACPAAGTACPSFTHGSFRRDGAKSLFGVLAHCNDRHAWTRERCADWL